MWTLNWQHQLHWNRNNKQLITTKNEANKGYNHIEKSMETEGMIYKNIQAE